jgi:uncharacterized membrane protein
VDGAVTLADHGIAHSSSAGSASRGSSVSRASSVGRGRIARLLGRLRQALLVIAALAPLAGYFALRTGQGTELALALAAVQVVAVGLVVGTVGGFRRSTMLLLPAAMLAAWAVVADRSAGQGVAVAAGITHAASYGGLLLLFGLSLLPGRDDLVTGIARRLNPHFHAGMQGYTRGVTWAWTGLFLVELLVSAALLCWAPTRWPEFTSFGHLAPVVALMVGEYTLRRLRFGSHSTDFRTMLRDFRRRRPGDA